MKIKFEIVALEDARVFECVNGVSAAMEKYHQLLDNYGWTKQEYEAELLKRIDNN
jgi:hypothetical protein